MMKDYTVQDKLQDSLKEVEKEANENRIKLEQLRKGYIEIASAYHLINTMINTSGRHLGENWLKCEAMTCTSHRLYLTTLELSYK